jgi:alkylated DNA repair dioxygenase AlkB
VTPAIPGLRYLTDYLERDEHDRLLTAVNSTNWRYAGARRAQVYGYSYHHLKGGIYRVADLPPWAADLAQRLCQSGLMPYVADQMIANEYPVGTGIFPHVDAPIFDDTIVSVSLGFRCVMQFTEAATGRVEEVLVEPRSALVFAGEAREKWKHAIPARTQDYWQDQVVERGTRVSLTFRRMLRTSGMA